MTIVTKEMEASQNMAVDGVAVIERVEPLFFRQKQMPLYACHHFPFGDSSSNATLICNSVVHEYERCHRSLRQLAMQLARSGQHVMRFDFTGIGNSAGEFSDVSFDQWRSDISDAIDECKVRTGAKSVSLVGVRVGAALAAQVAAQRDDVKCLVMYGPVFDGAALLSEWIEEQEKFLDKHSHNISEAYVNEILGFPVDELFRTELTRALAVSVNLTSLMKRVLVVSENDEKESVEKFMAGGAGVERKIFDDAAIWKPEPMESMVPIKTLRSIAAWMEGVV